MLLFIGVPINDSNLDHIFQNIVCYCLSKCFDYFLHIIDISKHRMLLFIKNQEFLQGRRLEISKHRMLLFIKKPDCFPFPFQNFKTSYVTVYQKAAVPFFRIQGTFQNIVCYCLSIHRGCLRKS